MNVIEKLLILTASRFDVPVNTLQPDDDFFSKLGINSIQAINLLSDIENTFNIEIPDYELKGVTTFRQLADRILQRL